MTHRVRISSIDACLALAALAFAGLSFVREGMSPLAELPTLAIAQTWILAAPFIIPIVALAVVASILFARRPVVPAPLRGALVAGCSTAGFAFAYGWCSEGLLAGLPMIGGCHCWIVGAAGAIAAVAAAVVFALARPFVAKALRILGTLVTAFLRQTANRAASLTASARAGAGYASQSAPLSLHRALRAPPALG